MEKSVNNPVRPTRTPKSPLSFLRKIWREYKSGYVFAGTKCRRSGTWKDHPFRAPISLEVLEKFFWDYPKEDYDLYFCLNSFKGKRRKAIQCRPTRWVQVDVDHNDPDAYPIPANIVTETSKGSYQAYWRFENKAQPKVAQAYSRKLVYEWGGDKSGHSVTKMLRIPFTINHKPTRNGEKVKLLRFDLSPVELCSLDELSNNEVDLDTTLLETPTGRIRHVWVSSAPQVMKRYGRKVSHRAKYLINRRYVAASDDRSRCIFQIVAGLHRAGADPEEIACVLVISEHFKSKYGIGNWSKAVDEVERIIPRLEDRS